MTDAVLGSEEVDPGQHQALARFGPITVVAVTQPGPATRMVAVEDDTRLSGQGAVFQELTRGASQELQAHRRRVLDAYLRRQGGLSISMSVPAPDPTSGRVFRNRPMTPIQNALAN